MRNPPSFSPCQPLPRTVVELIDELAKRYPEPSPVPGMSLDEVLFNAGRRSVILMLLAWQAQTRQKDFQTDVSR